MAVDSRPLSGTGRELPTPTVLYNDGNPVVSLSSSPRPTSLTEIVGIARYIECQEQLFGF